MAVEPKHGHEGNLRVGWYLDSSEYGNGGNPCSFEMTWLRRGFDTGCEPRGNSRSGHVEFHKKYDDSFPYGRFDTKFVHISNVRIVQRK
jgi:hypothetical protein